MLWTYKCVIQKVIDGDTVDVEINLGFDIKINERIRLLNIDAPEVRTRDLVEKELGLAAKAYVEELMPPGSKQIIKTQYDRRGKFGRVLGVFELQDGTDLADRLIEAGLGYRA